MRILASNPDTIGDMVLRQPLYRALLDAGHELMLIVRQSVAPMAAMIAPEAALLVLPAEVYAPIDGNWSAFEPIIYDARDWTPDLLLIAPYQWTEFEERLAEDLRGVPGLQVAGMSGRLYAGDPFAGAPPVSTLRLDRILEVDEDVPEADKNALLADMLGAPVASVNPVLTADEASIADARRVLAERGFSPGDYWIACVTGTANVPIKAWPAERWAQVLQAWHERYGRRFLFVGLPEERTVVEQVIAGMGDAGRATAVWMEPGGSVVTLAALASLSQGYAGHDTGPMHIAAAADRPVLAIFGGGHKLRFTPRVTPSAVLSVRVPCAGCGWACSFARAHCVDALRVVDVVRAVDDLEVGRIFGQDIRLLPLSADVHDEMTAFAADLSRDRLRSLSAVRRELEAVDATEIPRLQQALATQTQHGESLLQQLTESAAEVQRQHAANIALAQEAAGLARQLEEREQAVEALRQAAAGADARIAAEAEARRADVEPLRKELESLRHQLETIEALAVARRAGKSWRERVVDLVCGARHYEPKRLPRPMPKICLVTRVLNHELDGNIRRTIDSVLAERYPHLEYVLTAENVDRPIVREYAERVTKIMPLGDRPFAATAEAFAGADTELVAWLYVGQSYEPGALFRIGEYFRDHSLAMAAAFEQTALAFGQMDGRGWRLHQGRPLLGVESLRKPCSDTTRSKHVVFRRDACTLLGPLNPQKGTAAGWDLMIRFSRRFGIRKGRGHSICNFNVVLPWQSQSADADFKAASDAFEATFGWLGRLRSAVLHEAGVYRKTFLPARRTLGDRWLAVDNAQPPKADRVDADAAQPADPLATPISPVTRRRPDRLLLSAPDIASDDRTLHRAYYDALGDAAIAFPSVERDTIDRLLAGRARIAQSEVRPPADGTSSPFRRFVGGPRWAGIVAALPTPYWRLTGSKAGADSDVARLLAIAGKAVRADAQVRALVVGCYNGSNLDALKALTRWTLTGLETNADAATQAEGKGHRVVRCSAQDAFMTLPDGEVFDLIFVPTLLEHWDDPVWVLRRLSRLLKPTGRIVVRTPNLDSLLLRRFGPTWWHWQLPHHRVLFGRRGLRQLAAAVDLKVDRLRTITEAYAAAASVQLNDIGLAGVVPEGATFDRGIGRRGAKWAGWSRTLWDRWGRGDEIWAVLRPV